MSGGDRGGVADLIQTIKHSRIPVICICNDKYSQKIKSLRNHTLMLDFHKWGGGGLLRALNQSSSIDQLHQGGKVKGLRNHTLIQSSFFSCRSPRRPRMRMREICSTSHRLHLQTQSNSLVASPHAAAGPWPTRSASACWKSAAKRDCR